VPVKKKLEKTRSLFDCNRLPGLLSRPMRLVDGPLNILETWWNLYTGQCVRAERWIFSELWV